MNLARYSKFPDVRHTGLFGLPPIVAFASRHSHYSNRKNASLLGIGSDNVVAVECDENGRMDPKDLELKIKEAKEEVRCLLLLFIIVRLD